MLSENTNYGRTASGTTRPQAPHGLRRQIISASFYSVEAWAYLSLEEHDNRVQQARLEITALEILKMLARA